MNDQALLEGLAEGALSQVDPGLSKAVSMLSISKALGLEIRRVSGGELPRGASGLIDGRTVYVQTTLSPTAERFVLGHEIGHYLCSHREHSTDAEMEADYVAAALTIPRRALKIAIRHLSQDLQSLAVAFQSTQTSVALRLAESGIVEVALVVEPRVIRARAASEFVLPPNETIRRLVSAPSSQFQRKILTDAPKRIAILVDGIWEAP